MIIYVIINAGVWGMLFWPIYRPMSLFASASTQTPDKGQRNRAAHSTDANKQALRRPTAQISTGQLSNGAAPQFLWD
jgi:hypothetical protein